VSKNTEPPAVIVVFPAGSEMDPSGAEDPANEETCTHLATDGTPAESRRKSM
jgi:hypothetical protein